MISRPERSAVALVFALLFCAGCGAQGAIDIDEKSTTPSTSQSFEVSRSSETLLPLDVFFSLFQDNPVVFGSAAEQIFSSWDPAYTPMVLEAARFGRQRDYLLGELQRVSDAEFGGDLDRALRWSWARDIKPHPEYAAFKTRLYGNIDSRFAAYFDDGGDNARIRLDEIHWGGVARDGIPPLKGPTMMTAADADYLEDDHIVFGVEIAGDARAYPRRILAWHEMVKDVVGNVSVNGVYCTLCGTMILYRTEVDGTHYELGTSGFLYRSNKLMYDHDTESMWSTITGEPVLGPLVGKGIKLEPLYLVTTTWGQWKTLHPDTQVLSLETGHERDYGEGVAYRNYFATDELMFAVPFEDRRLRNKDEVLALRFGANDLPIAIEVAFLAQTPLVHGRHDGVAYAVLTDRSGANRVYASAGRRFASYDGATQVTDSEGNRWKLHEEALVRDDGARLERLPAHRAFWFGWHAAHPETRLVRSAADARGAGAT